MSGAVVILNNSSELKIWGGQSMDASSQYTLQSPDHRLLLNDEYFIADLRANKAVLAYNNRQLDSTQAITALNLAIPSNQALIPGLDTRERVFKVSIYNHHNNLESETWYDTDNGGGTYSGKAIETIYTYNETHLISKTITTYYYDGSIASVDQHNYYQDSSKIIEKIEGE